MVPIWYGCYEDGIQISGGTKQRLMWTAVRMKLNRLLEAI